MIKSCLVIIKYLLAQAFSRFPNELLPRKFIAKELINYRKTNLSEISLRILCENFCILCGKKINRKEYKSFSQRAAKA